MRIRLFIIFLAFSGMAKGQNTFWQDWFLQAGVDMSLMNPYGCNFSQVFPRGKTFGVNVAVGKWFSPLFASAAYQVTTSESSGGYTGMEVSKGSNGYFDIDMGVVLDLNRNTSYKYQHKPPVAAHNWPRFIANTAASVAVGYIGKTALKGMISEERPDHSDNKSFPSGHATMAFAAARSIDKEFRSESIWIPIAGYAAATAIGVERVASDRHHWYDVVAGAALGYGASELTWWLSDKIFPQNKNVAVTFNGNTLEARIFLDK